MHLWKSNLNPSVGTSIFLSYLKDIVKVMFLNCFHRLRVRQPGLDLPHVEPATIESRSTDTTGVV